MHIYMLRVRSSLCVHLNGIQVRGACSSAGCHDVILPPLHLCFHASLSHTTVGRLKRVCVCVSGAKGEGLGSVSRPLLPVSPACVSLGFQRATVTDSTGVKPPEEPPRNNTHRNAQQPLLLSNSLRNRDGCMGLA